MRNIFFMMPITTLIHLSCWCQVFRDVDIDKTRNLDRVQYYYDGVLLGCNFSADCKGLNVKFTKIIYNKKENKLYVAGKVFWETENRPMPGVKIFSARVKDSVLFDLKQIDSTYKRKGVRKFPYAMGSFSGDFEVTKGRKLFILHPFFS